MTERPKFFDDLAGVAGGALSAFSGLRDETTALVRARVDEAIRKLDLVRREEFDVANDLAAKARLDLAALTARVASLEKLMMPAVPAEVPTQAGAAHEPPTQPVSETAQDSSASI